MVKPKLPPHEEFTTIFMAALGLLAIKKGDAFAEKYHSQMLASAFLEYGKHINQNLNKRVELAGLAILKEEDGVDILNRVSKYVDENIDNDETRQIRFNNPFSKYFTEAQKLLANQADSP